MRLRMQNPAMFLNFQEKFKFEKERWIPQPLESRNFHIFDSFSWDSEATVSWLSYHFICFRLSFIYNNIPRLYPKAFMRKCEKSKNALGFVLRCFQTTNSNSCPNRFRILRSTIPGIFSNRILSCIFLPRHLQNSKEGSAYTMIKSENSSFLQLVCTFLSFPYP